MPGGAGPPRRDGNTVRAAIKADRWTPSPAITSRPANRPSSAGAASATKTQRFLALVVERYGPLAEFPIASVSKVCSELAPEVDLNTGAARTALRRQVQAAQNGSLS